LGLLSYTIASWAMGLWPFSHQNTPIAPSPPGPSSHDSGSSLSVGAIVTVGIVGFFVIYCLIGAFCEYCYMTFMYYTIISLR
jgi:hypothetical protein